MAPCIRVVWSSRCIQGRRAYVPRPESGFGAASDRLFRMSLCMACVMSGNRRCPVLV